MLCPAAATRRSRLTPSLKTRLGRTREACLPGTRDVNSCRGTIDAPNRDVRLGEIWLLGITEEDEAFSL